MILQLTFPQKFAMVSPSTSSTRIRSNGRSMRTVRSRFFHNNDEDEPNYSLPKSTSVSEVLTDSVVDFHLRELATAVDPTASKSASIDAATDLLELSGGFSDFSSFGSDISGELQKLVALVSKSPLQAAGPHSFDLDEADAVESMPAEAAGPAVLSSVETLRSGSMDEKRAAAGRIRLIAKHRSDLRPLIGESGAIGALIPLLKSTDPAAQENAVTALLNLSLEEANKDPITAAGAIKPLVYALRTGTATAKQNAACALLSLSTNDDSRMTIGVVGAIPPLISLLINGSTRGKKDALTTLYKLCSVRQNKERAVSAGAVGPLVGLVGERGSGMSEKAMVVLSSLAAVEEGRAAIVDEGGIPVLVEAMEEGPARGREFAVLALLQLCLESGTIRGLLVREGAIPPLVALSQSGSSRAKQKLLVQGLCTQAGHAKDLLIYAKGRFNHAGARSVYSTCLTLKFQLYIYSTNCKTALLFVSIIDNGLDAIAAF
ncbi:putative U-box domain-containing protein 4 [Iris pallida]|uniref:U-box domain-containing protein 4 n=1 Tax=Iris pallida TaxID=29817 RepID=A0AAX6EW02_IRIPA|nr:putative U-box domain-containing protein 4 [Iris pallida]KAJ6812811.1 putative U-box domain-containing protein 4 [Iris pallida]